MALVRKELARGLRSAGGWLLPAGMLAAFAVLGLDALAGDGPAWETGRKLFSYAVYSQIGILIGLLTPFAAGNLARETDRKSLEVLRVSSRGEGRLAAAKLLTPLCTGVTAVLLCAPFVFAARALGGVFLREPCELVVLGCLTALLASAVGLLAGALAGGAASAQMLAVLAAGWCLWRGYALRQQDTLLAVQLLHPLGAARAIVGGRAVNLYGTPVPHLLPLLFLAPVVAFGLFFSTLPALSTPYKTRAMPVRCAFGVALALIVFAAVGSPEPSGHPPLIAFDNILLVLCFVAVLVLTLESTDNHGFLRTVPGSGEDENNRRSGAARRWLASSAGLALLIPAAALPASAAFGNCMLPGDLSGRQIWLFVAGGWSYLAAWCILCLAFSHLDRALGPKRKGSTVWLVLPLLVLGMPLGARLPIGCAAIMPGALFSPFHTVWLTSFGSYVTLLLLGCVELLALACVVELAGRRLAKRGAQAPR